MVYGKASSEEENTRIYALRPRPDADEHTHETGHD
jgi:hypothetical protein